MTPLPDRPGQRAEVYRDRIAVLFALAARARSLLEPLPPELKDGAGLLLRRDLDDAMDVVAQLEPDDADVATRLLSSGILVSELAANCEELARGAAARADGVDDVACSLADRLVTEVKGSLPLPTWSTYCVPGVADAYSRRSTVIHVGLASRLDMSAVWTAPAVAHELGHQVATLLLRHAGTSVLPEVQAVIQRAGRADPVLGAHVSELFADCFAAWVVGPAYGVQACWLGFGLGATTEDEDSDTHPSPRRRIRQVTLTLRRVGGLDDAANRIEQLLRDVAVEDESEQGGDPGADPVDPWCDELRELLAGRLSGGRYLGWPTAQGLAPGLVAPGAARPAHAGPPAVVDVVNAAWWARVHNPQLADRISDRAAGLLS